MIAHERSSQKELAFMATSLGAGKEQPVVQSVGVATRGQQPQRSSLQKRPRPIDGIVRALLFFCGILSILTTIALVAVLLSESLAFFTSGLVTLPEFLFGTRWQPVAGDFGILPLLNATIVTSFWAMVVALPLGIGGAIYLSEYAKGSTRDRLKPILEILAGIPTVTYGFFALTFMTPVLRIILGENNVSIYNMLSAGLVMGIMILPTIASMSEDALRAVPNSLREASYGLGATKFETVSKVVVPAALSGLIASFIVGIARAVGETMIVALAAGAGPVAMLTANPMVSGETITGHIARISGGDLSYASIDYQSLFALGLALFVFTLGLNFISQWVTRRFREVYQ
ncbi:MAG: phosphate ABC transporter permease [Chloroflexi bacterium OLB15]|nr:MAG: phosphate ABC transporter permease [Chloroflexi bacterium OLB15]